MMHKRKNRMRLGVIGLGSMGTRRLSHATEQNAFEIYGYDIREDRGSQAAERFNIRLVRNIEQLIHLGLDVVFICVPPADHFQYLRMAIDNNWHFMVENPVAHKLGGLMELEEEIEKKQLVANVSCNLRFNENIRKIKELIQNNQPGKVLSGLVEIGEWLPDWHPWEPYTDYYPSRRSMGGGLDSICDLDWLVDIFGEIENSECLAAKKSSLKIDTFDVVDFILQFKNGPQIAVHSDMLQTPYSHSAKFISENGVIIWQCHEQKVRMYDNSRDKWFEWSEEAENKSSTKTSLIWAEEMYRKDSAHFFKCLKGEAKPLNTVGTNRELLRFVLESISYNE